MKCKNVKLEKKSNEKVAEKKFFFSENQLVWGSRLLFFVFSFCFLGIFNSELLYKLQNVNFFLSNSIFFENTLQQSSGLLLYVSGFLTQLLYYPLLGALIISISLSVLEICVRNLFTIPFKYFMTSFLPSGFILLAQTSIGYAVYDRFDSSFVFSLLIGVFCMLLLIYIDKYFSKYRFGIVISLATAVVAFPFIGSYASFAIIVIAVDKLAKRDKKKYMYWIIGLSIIILFPCISSIYYTEKYVQALLAPIVNPYFLNLFIFSILTVFFLVCYSFLFTRTKNEINISSKNRIFNIAGLGIFILAIFYFSFRDENFKTEITMQHLCEQRKWNEILKKADKVEMPTKAIVAYRAIALSNKGILARDLFKYPCKLKAINSQYLTDQPIYYEDLFLYASFPNNAYMWAMEFWVTTGQTYEHLKKMTLCAIFNGEPELAKRYLRLLKQTFFQSEWVDEYENYIYNYEKLCVDNPEFLRINYTLPIQEKIITVDPFIKTYLAYNRLSPVNVERRILSDLYRKDMTTFTKDILEARLLYQKGMPDCIKEALVICAINGNPKILAPFKVERPFALKVNEFFRELRNYSNKDTAAQKLKKRYGGMYCYYFVFSESEQ